MDAQSDPSAITWPWAGAVYAQSIRLAISDWQEGPLTPLVVRFFPGHQETIMGSEGVIVTKRLLVPWKGPEDRALLWLLECQAEGDRLVKLEVEIDWGEPLTQRMVDGLLVAQRNPEDARGIYAQSNAESTRVFGDPYGQPTEVHLEDPQRARLVYLILVNGIVEVPLLLTFSDVGEQVAWNSFLALRDVEQIFDIDQRQLEPVAAAWSPVDARTCLQPRRGNWPAPRHPPGATSPHRLGAGRPPGTELPLAGGRVGHHRSHHQPEPARTSAAGGRGDRRLAARIAADAPQSSRRSTRTAAGIAYANGAYLHALNAHYAHHGDSTWLAEHYPTAQRCAEQLVQLRWQDRASTNLPLARQVLAVHLGQALRLAQIMGDAVNTERWGNELAYLLGKAGVAPREEQFGFCARRLGGTLPLAATQPTCPGPSPQPPTAWRWRQTPSGVAVALLGRKVGIGLRQPGRPSGSGGPC